MKCQYCGDVVQKKGLSKLFLALIIPIDTKKHCDSCNNYWF